MPDTATTIVARWQHMDEFLTDPFWQSIDAYRRLLFDLWQAAKLGAQAEAEVVRLNARLAWYENAPNRKASAT